MLRRWAPSAALAVLVFGLSIVPPGKVGVVDVSGLDKAVHFAVYFLLAVLINRAARWPCLSCGLAVTAGCGGFGALIEFLQRFTGREPDVFDALANLLGAALGSWLYIHLRLKRAKLET